jgi:hypothetical protein
LPAAAELEFDLQKNANAMGAMKREDRYMYSMNLHYVLYASLRVLRYMWLPG